MNTELQVPGGYFQLAFDVAMSDESLQLFIMDIAVIVEDNGIFSKNLFRARNRMITCRRRRASRVFSALLIGRTCCHDAAKSLVEERA
jgi:hypothetical protein